MRKVELTMDEQRNYEVIKKLVDTNGNKNRAQITLGYSSRHINRLIADYKKRGKAAFSHGNKGKTPVHAISDECKNEICLLYENKYYDANFTHFTEILEEHEGIDLSESTIRNIMHEKGILSPKAHKATKKAYKEKLEAQKKHATTQKEKKQIEQKLLIADDPHPRRPRCQHAGEMIQMDASLHLWFGCFKTTLHVAIDDATGTLVGAYFDDEETLKGYYHVLRQILMMYGIPYMFYTDNRTVFAYKRRNIPHVEEDTYTQFSYTCKQLGVDVKTTSVPQAKGRVERVFETLQSRLPVELRLAGVTTIEQANEFLASYLKKFNDRFALDMDCIKSVFDTQVDKTKIDLYLSVLTPRKIDAGHCIKFQNTYYALLNEKNERIYLKKGTDVLVIQTLSGMLYASVAETVFALETVPTHERLSRNFYSEEQPKKEKKKYIPPMDHPWRKDNFMKYVYAMLGKEEQWAS